MLMTSSSSSSRGYCGGGFGDFFSNSQSTAGRRSSRRSSRRSRTTAAGDDQEAAAAEAAAAMTTAIDLMERIDLQAAEMLLSDKGARAAVESAHRARRRLPPDDEEEEDGAAATAIDWDGIKATVDVARVYGGALPVQYFKPVECDGYGRLRARVSLGREHELARRCVPFVHMVREVRAVLARKWYWDVDFVNCQPTLLRQALERERLPCPALARYVDRRKEHLADIADATGCSVDDAKALVLRLVYGGSARAWARDCCCCCTRENHSVHDPDAMLARLPKWVAKLAAEVDRSGRDLTARMDDLSAFVEQRMERRRGRDNGSSSNSSSNNDQATKLAIHLQTLECACVTALLAAVRASRRHVGGIIYDGLHVERLPGDGGEGGAIPQDLLDTWTAHIHTATGFRLQLSVKPFQTPVDIPTELPAAGRAQQQQQQQQQLHDWLEGRSVLAFADAKELWERFVFKVVEANVFVRQHVADDRRVCSEKQLLESYRHVHYADAGRQTQGGGLAMHPFVPRWINDARIRQFRRMVMAPPPHACSDTSYNLWRPFAAALGEHVPCENDDEPSAAAAQQLLAQQLLAQQLLAQQLLAQQLLAQLAPLPEADGIELAAADSDAVKVFVGFLHVLAGRNAQVTRYVLDWLAQLFQQPGRKTGVALVLKGEEGVGKNRFTDLLRAMVGADKFLQTANPATTLYGRFTRLREGKILVVVNEASGTDGFAFNNQIKDMITCDEFVSEGKGTNSYTMACFARFIFTTNNCSPVRVSSDSRRWEIVEVSSELKGNTAFFAGLSDLIASTAARAAFYRWLMSRDVSRIDWINDRPITDYYVTVVQQSLPPEHRFLKSLLIEEAQRKQAAASSQGGGAVSTTRSPPHRGRPSATRGRASDPTLFRATTMELFERFKDWLPQTSSLGRSTYETTLERFGLRLTDLIIIPSRSPGTGTADVRIAAGAQKMRGMSKQRERGGVTYEFQLPTVLRELVRLKWAAAEDVEPLVRLFPPSRSVPSS